MTTHLISLWKYPELTYAQFAGAFSTFPIFIEVSIEWLSKPDSIKLARSRCNSRQDDLPALSKNALDTRRPSSPQGTFP